MGKLIKKLLFAGVYMGIVLGGYGLYDYIFREEEKPEPVVEIKPIVEIKGPWNYEETKYGFCCTKKGDLKIEFDARYKTKEIKNSRVVLSIHHKNGEGFEIGDGNSTGTINPLIDGNVDTIRIYTNTLNDCLFFNDEGDIVQKNGYLKSYPDDKCKELLEWAQKKFKDIKDELKEAFGDKVYVPKEGEPLSESIDRIIEKIK